MTRYLKCVSLDGMLSIREEQVDKLSDLFMFIGKSLLLATFTVSIFTPAELVGLLKLLISGIVCVYFSLKIIEVKKYGS